MNKPLDPYRPVQKYDELVAICSAAAEDLDFDLANRILSKWWSSSQDFDAARTIIRDTWEDLKKNPASREILSLSLRRQAVVLTLKGEYYTARRICETTEQDFRMLVDHARKRGILDSVDLEDSIHEYGTASDVDDALAQDKIRDDLHYEYTSERVASALRPVNQLVTEYLASSDLAAEHHYVAGHRLLPTAAMQLQQQDYDHVIGIFRGGAPLPNFMLPLDQNVSYIEYHNHWKQAPRWRANSQVQKLRDGMRVLLCEDDAVSGNTLRKVMQKLDKASPSSIDLCFTGQSYERSRAVAESLGAFDHIFHLTHVDQSRVYSDMLEYRKKLEEALEKKRQIAKAA